ARVRERAAGLGKPVTFCFLGGDDGVDDAITLKGAVEKALGHVFETFQPEAENARPGGAIRGLFCGGTLCAEAQVIARAAGLSVHSNVPVPGAGTERASAHHQFIDFGADEYTAGRPHPMIDPSVRSAALKDALTDPCVGVVLLDVVLGFGADDDPATHVCVVVESAPGDRPPIVAYVCGTDADPQVSTRQVERLRAAGVIVAPTNADAADAAVHLVSG
ncbi:MAG: oxidoreductase, partial [Pseudomonadota bacterium]